MSVILGLNCYHADSSACLIINNKLEYGVEEERIIRKKHWAGLPINSIIACLKYKNLKLSDITDIAINTNPFSNLTQKTRYFLKNYIIGSKKKEILLRNKKKFKLLDEINNNFKLEKLNKNIKLHFIDHHISHISSAFFPSKFKKSIGLSVDGFGDFCSIAIAKCEDNKINIVERVYFPHSLGVFYEAFTQLIGFKNYGDEYKFMGLSSYGKPEFFDLILRNFFEDRNLVKLNLKYFNHIKGNFSYKSSGIPNQSKLLNNEIKKLFKSKINMKSQNHRKNIASSVQKVFEYKIIQLILKIKKIKFSKNLVYAGGCALNSLANKKIFDVGNLKNIFIPYAPGDGGGSIGAALTVASKKYGFKNFKNIDTPYIGPSYENNEILEYIKKNKKLKKFKIKIYENSTILNSQIANLIYQNKIIGHFSGKMEFGARALGNRSILANPCNPKIKDIINNKIKRRENFRPFAPAILKEKKKYWFGNTRDNPYMSSVELILKKKQNKIPAVTHIDGTGRIQTITKKNNSKFYAIIKKFEKLSGVPIILNTSFNENEPIVMNYIDAINCFLRTKMDVLVLNNILIKRNN